VYGALPRDHLPPLDHHADLARVANVCGGISPEHQQVRRLPNRERAVRREPHRVRGVARRGNQRIHRRETRALHQQHQLVVNVGQAAVFVCRFASAHTRATIVLSIAPYSLMPVAAAPDDSLLRHLLQALVDNRRTGPTRAVLHAVNEDCWCAVDPKLATGR